MGNYDRYNSEDHQSDDYKNHVESRLQRNELDVKSENKEDEFDRFRNGPFPRKREKTDELIQKPSYFKKVRAKERLEKLTSFRKDKLKERTEKMSKNVKQNDKKE